jgi:hypothetical protein
VGNDGEQIVADSSTSTGLRWQGSQAAAKNCVINGGMDIWQRGTSSASQGYVTADRWYMTGASTTFSQETSDVPTGFRYALKCTMSGTAQPQPILTVETNDAIRFAGQTVMLSYYVKTSNSTPAVMRVDYSNNVDESVTGTYTTIATYSVATTTSWQRVALSFAVPSTSKTIRVVVGASGNLTTGQTILLTGVQLELGSVATTFTRAGGTIQGELAACQRYYYKHIATENVAVAFASGTAIAQTALNFPVTMRIAPTITLPASGSSTGQIAFLNSSANYPATIGTLAANRISVSAFSITTTSATSAFTAGNASVLFVTGTTQTAYEASAEL